MALINCPECKNQVSDTAATCPNCGAPIKGASEAKAAGSNLTTTQSTSKRLKLHMLISSLIFLIGVTWFFVASQAAAENPGIDVNVAIPGWFIIVGAVWFLITRFRIWWHHK